MPGDTCVVCGNTRAKDKSVSMRRFPQDEAKRQRWIEALGLQDFIIKGHHRVCSRHFPNADARNDPQLTLGKRFASPKKQWTGRVKRAKKREEHRRDPMARLTKRQRYRPLSASQLLGARCLEARCLGTCCIEVRCLGAHCLAARCLGLQTSLEAERYLRAVTSGGR